MNLQPLGVLMLLSPVWPVVALAAAILFYVRHGNRIEPARRVPLVLYVLALLVCGGVATVVGVNLGVNWACSDPKAGNLCGLVGFLVVGPIAGTLAVFLVGLALFLVRPAEKPH